TLAGAAQMRRINRRQIIPPKTELGNGHGAQKENSPARHRGAPYRWQQHNQRNQNQPWNLKNVKQTFPAKNKNSQNCHQDAPSQASGLLISLQNAYYFQLVQMGQFSYPRSPGNDAGKMLQHPKGSGIGARHHEAAQQSRLAKFRME